MQQWLQRMEGDATIIGLKKALDDIERTGRREGRQEGLLEGKQAVARELISMGMNTAAIIQATGFTSEKSRAIA